MEIVTKELLSLGVNEDSTINESQLVLLSIESENLDNWETLAMGKQLSDSRAELFVLLNGVDDKKLQEKIIKNYKALQKFRKSEKEKEQVVENPKKCDGDVVVYCDGGCVPNPGKSGSGVAVYRDGKVSELWYGLYEPMGTNNTAELNALYQSLLIAQKELESGNRVEIKCDSMYSINCIKTWAISWEKKGWTKKGGEIKNLEIIKECYFLYNNLKANMELSHIKAHSGLEGNELADRMTIYAIEQKDEEFVKYSEKINVDEILVMSRG